MKNTWKIREIVPGVGSAVYTAVDNAIIMKLTASSSLDQENKF